MMERVFRDLTCVNDNRENMSGKLKSFLEEYRNTVTPMFQEYFETKLRDAKNIDSSVEGLVGHFIDIAPRGKMVRGVLTVLGYKFVGGEEVEKVQRVSVGVELLEAGILIQDDFMDRDEVRRGVASIHMRYSDLHLGNTMAVLAGDMSFGWALERIYRSGFDTDLILRAVMRYNELFYETVYGQILDVYTASRGSVTREQIEKINKFKTAQYTFVLPLSVGTILAGASREYEEKVAEFGRMGGIVFQMRDDWLGVFGESERTGKSVENDLREKKENIVAEVARERMGEEFEKLRSRIGGNGVGDLVQKMRKAEVDLGVQEVIEEKIEECLRYLATIEGEGEAKELLGEMVKFVGRRDK